MLQSAALDFAMQQAFAAAHRPNPRAHNKVPLRPPARWPSDTAKVYPQAAPARREGRQLMTLVGLIILLVVGAVAGWLAGLIVKGFGFGLIGNIVVGIVGAVIAGFLLPRLGILIGGGIIAEIINAVIGAVILLLIIGVFKKAT